jgi:hypothetical protein
MPNPLDEPLWRTSLNLFHSDVVELERRHGRGWSEVVRNLVRAHIKDTTEEPKTVTIGDLFGKRD